jgi:hypothetical protein
MKRSRICWQYNARKLEVNDSRSVASSVEFEDSHPDLSSQSSQSLEPNSTSCLKKLKQSGPDWS